MPILVRFLIRNALIGLSIALIAMSAILAFDLAGLRSLAMASDMGVVGICALTSALGLTFASAQMGFAVMLLDDAHPEDRGTKSHRRLNALLRPAPSALRARGVGNGEAETHSLP